MNLLNVSSNFAQSALIVIDDTRNQSSKFLLAATAATGIFTLISNAMTLPEDNEIASWKKSAKLYSMILMPLPLIMVLHYLTLPKTPLGSIMGVQPKWVGDPTNWIKQYFSLSALIHNISLELLGKNDVTTHLCTLSHLGSLYTTSTSWKSIRVILNKSHQNPNELYKFELNLRVKNANNPVAFGENGEPIPYGQVVKHFVQKVKGFSPNYFVEKLQGVKFALKIPNLFVPEIYLTSKNITEGTLQSYKEVTLFERKILLPTIKNYDLLPNLSSISNVTAQIKKIVNGIMIKTPIF